MTFIPIAEYRPDTAFINSGYSHEIVNVLPAPNSYIPFPMVAPVSDPFPDVILGVYAVRSLGGVRIIVGAPTKLYEYDNSTRGWKDISKPHTQYHANETALWSFASFGDHIIAVNSNDPPQMLSLKTEERFCDVGGNPPRAGLVRVWGDFVCLMQLTDKPNRVQWSGLNDATHWTVGEKSCDYQDFPDGEYVQGSTESTNPLIFMRSAIYHATFVPGSKIIFSFAKIKDKIGAKSSTAIASRGDCTFFASDDGFYQINSAGEMLPIGFGKVDKTIFTLYNNFAIDEMRACIDPVYSRVYFSINDNTEGMHIYVYDWLLQIWSVIKGQNLLLFPLFAAGYTLEGLDEVQESLKDLPASLDSKMWQNGAPVLGAFTPDNKFGFFAGPPMEAVIASQIVGDTGRQINLMSEAFVQADTTKGFLSVGAAFIIDNKNQLNWAKERYAGYNIGMYNIRSRARYHALRLRIPEGTPWTHITGFDVTLKPAGIR
ncbi:hypothetical protein [Bartonella grahamii]|uniref:Phage protein n=1 Tax=Bartonella grahamii TaxID=33045 RepID=A0A336NN60_BARGR|nr:hypothetical protein [Bartonella grahamii]SSZ40349.1 Uncharacterised protein [Bartonella grahamii]